MQTDPITNNIHFIEDNDWQILAQILHDNTGSIYVLADSNTFRDCYPVLLRAVPQLKDSAIIEIEPGEENKDLEICSHIWQTLTEQNAGRDSLILNLGGGVVTDIGGFVAAVYKRGISYVHVPTSLLGMVDAAVGGKTGVDFLGFKNQIGVYAPAFKILIWDGFLDTLPEEEIVAGYAEVLKYALISDLNLWDSLWGKELEDLDWQEVIKRSVAIKSAIVSEDPYEHGQRKLLNFGHTVGHALESYFLLRDNPIRHGEAVAAGMLCAAFLSVWQADLPESRQREIVLEIDRHFTRLKFRESDFDEIVSYIAQDKKSIGGKNRFVLLKEIGEATWGIQMDMKLLKKALLLYLNKK